MLGFNIHFDQGVQLLLKALHRKKFDVSHFKEQYFSDIVSILKLKFNDTKSVFQMNFTNISAVIHQYLGDTSVNVQRYLAPSQLLSTSFSSLLLA